MERPLKSHLRPPLPPAPYLIAGFGRAGQAAARSLASRASADTIYFNDDLLDAERDRAAAAVADSLGIERLREPSGAYPWGLDPPPATLIKSPGIRPDVPLIAAASAAGMTVIDEFELGWRLDPRPFIAITGTNGKSTVAKLTLALLAANNITAELGGNTHFGPPISALEARDGVVLAEVSSFQLECCDAFLPDVALLTNLTHDHHYRHGNASSYAEIKRSMFIRGEQFVPRAAIGIDQPFGRELADDLRRRGALVVTFGFDRASDRGVLDLDSSLERSVVTVREGSRSRTLETVLPGRHNAQNVAAALALSDVMGWDAEASSAAISTTGAPPGRLEQVSTTRGPEVFVDFAHNPDGVASVLDLARETRAQQGSGRVIAMLSSMEFTGYEQGHAVARAAADRADLLVLTTNRPRVHFAHGELCPGLLEGAKEGARAEVVVELDRREAIRTALLASNEDDIVLLLERGAAVSPIFGADDVGVPFDERAVARELVTELGLDT